MRVPDLEAAEDGELLRAFVEDSDRDALEVLLVRHETRVYGLAYRMLTDRSDAQEATQEIFLTIFRKASSFRHESSFGTWLFRIATNVCHDFGRKRAKTPIPVEELPARDDDRPSLTDEIAVHQALAALIDEQRIVVVLRDIYGLSYQEISEITGVALGTVKSRIARGRLALGDLLREPPHQALRLSEKDL